MASKKQFSGSRLVARDREINKGAEWVLRATITLHGMDECPAPVLRRVANWLRAGADHLEANGKKYGKRFTARLRDPVKKS